jgi:hypothetical protein
MTASNASNPCQRAARAAATCALLAALAGCAPHVHATRTRPAEVDLRGLDHVVVGELGGEDGRALASALSRGLFATGRVDVLERTALETLPPSAVVAGDARTSTTSHVERRTTACTDLHERSGRECLEYTRTVTLSYDADLRIADSRTGRILAPASLQCTAAAKTSATDARPPDVEVEPLLASCRQDVVSRFVPLLVPTQVVEEVALLEDAALPALAAGNRLARSGAWPAARDAYVEATRRADSDAGLPPATKAKAHYAVGLSLLFTGALDAGIGELERAVALGGGHEAAALLPRARQWKLDAERLRSQIAPERARPER